MISARFTAKFGLLFVLTHRKKLFLRGFILKSAERAYVLLISGTRVFKIALRKRYRYGFMWHSLEILNVFSTLTLTKFDKFSRKRTLFKKLYHHFLVESTKIEKVSHFPTKLLCQKPMLRWIEWGVQMDLSKRTELC